MNIDWVPWGIRAILIAIGIILAIIIWKGNKERKYQESSFRFFVIGGTAFILGIVLLIVSFITGMFGDYGLFLTVTGVILFIIGLVVRNVSEKNR